MQPTSEQPDPPKRGRGRPKGSADKAPRKRAKRASQQRPERSRGERDQPRASEKSDGEREPQKKGPQLRPDPLAELARLVGAELPSTARSPRAQRQRRRVFFQTLTHGYSITKAARTAGIAPTSIRRLMKRHEVFRVAVENAREEGVDGLEDGLIQMAQGVRSAASFLPVISALKAKRPNTYRENIKVQSDSHVTIAPGEGFRSSMDAFAESVRAAAAAHIERLAGERAALALPDRKLLDLKPESAVPVSIKPPVVGRSEPEPSSAEQHLQPPPKPDDVFDPQREQREATGDRDFRYARGGESHG
jgi:hypothetical protein